MIWRARNDPRAMREVKPWLGDCIPPELTPIAPIRIGAEPARDPIKRGIDGFLMMLAMICVVVFSVGILALALSIASARRGHSHEWFPQFCCRGTEVGGDCGPIADRRVHPLIDGGYLIDGTFYVPATEVRQSIDGRFYACFPTKDIMQCFFAPARDM